MDLAFNETMSFEIQRMSSETSLIWQSRLLVRDSGSKRGEYECTARFDKLNSDDFQVKSVRIYSRLSLKPMVTGHRRNQISCRGTEMFFESNLVLQWVPGNGRVALGDTKMSQGRVSLCVSQKGVLFFLQILANMPSSMISTIYLDLCPSLLLCLFVTKFLNRHRDILTPGAHVYVLAAMLVAVTL